MEQWRRARTAILEDFAKAFDRVGSNLALGLEGKQIVENDELERLRNEASSVAELEQEKVSLLLQLITQQGAHQDQEDKAAEEVKYLRGDNAKLRRALQELQDAGHEGMQSGMKGGGSKTTSLHGVSDIARPVVGPYVRSPKATPRSSEHPLPIGKDVAKAVASAAGAEEYTALAEKYNRLHEHRNAIQDVSGITGQKLKNMSTSYRQYKLWGDQLGPLLAQKDDRIRRQDEKLTELRFKVQRLEQAAHDARSVLQAVSYGDVRQNYDNDATTDEPRDVAQTSSTTKFLGCLGGNEDLKRYHALDDASTQLLPSSSTERASSQSREECEDLTNTGRILEDMETMDQPVVVSSRSVRKRKIGGEETSPQPITKIKTDLGSSPIGLAALLAIEPDIDLDDIGLKVDTPRRKRMRMQYSQNDPQLHQRLDSHDLDVYSKSGLSARNGQRSTALEELDPNKQITPRASSLKRKISGPYRKASKVALEGVSEDGESIRVSEATHLVQPAGQIILGDLLTKPPPPKPVLVSDLRQTTLSLAKSHGYSGEYKDIPDSRDSGVGSTPANEETGPPFGGGNQVSAECLEPRHEHPRKPLMSSWLSIDGPGPALESPSEDSGASVDNIMVRNRAAPDPSEQSTAYGKSDPKRPDSAEEKISLHAKLLRHKPVEQLNLEDFKINPSYHPGCDFAWSEVVRGPDERRRLPGCTKPHCCGQAFEAMAANMRDPDQAPTPSQQEQDERLLERFMGRDFHNFRQYSPKERDETLLRARAWDLANEYGRHRHAFERRRTPPGFWNAEFPTTQEQQEEKAEVGAYERELVEQRYREAMRPNGVYIFQDE